MDHPRTLPGSGISASEICGLNETNAFTIKDLVTTLSSSRGPHMKIKLTSDLTEQVLYLTHEYGYAPDEILSMGITLAAVLLEERRLGNSVLVVAPNGDTVAEFKEVEPKAVHQIAKEYVQSICPEATETSAALLVARLERERDLEERQRR